MTVVVTVALSSAGLVSVPESVEIAAVLVIESLVELFTCTSSTNEALAPGANEPIVQLMSPASWSHVQPAGGVTER